MSYLVAAKGRAKKMTAHLSIQGEGVKVTRQSLSPEDVAGKRAANRTGVIRSLERKRSEEPDADRAHYRSSLAPSFGRSGRPRDGTGYLVGTVGLPVM